MNEAVSIVFATHNRASLLADALATLVQVQVPAGTTVEVIIVANGCTDDTPKVVERQARILPFPVRYVEESEANLSRARNRGITESRGGIVAFLDDDVFVDPVWLCGLLEVYKGYPADIVGGRVILSWDDVGGRPGWFPLSLEGLLGSFDRGSAVAELHRPSLIGCNLSFRRTALHALGEFDSNLGRSGSRLMGGRKRSCWAGRSSRASRFSTRRERPCGIACERNVSRRVTCAALATGARTLGYAGYATRGPPPPCPP